MTIHDAHTHLFSRPFFDGLAAQSPTGATPEQVAAKAGLELPPVDIAAHAAAWVAQLDRHGVTRAVSFASLPGEAPAVAAAARASGGRLIPYTLVNPKAPDAPAFVARAFGELGMRGVLTFPAMHHFLVSDDCMVPVLEAARAARAPVIVHCGALRVKLRDLFGLPRPFDLSFAHPLQIVTAANRFRDVNFVVPHFGGGLLHETLLLGLQCENVFVDTSSSNDWMAAVPGVAGLADVFRRALAVFGAERILFGTDSSTFPRGWRADILAAQRRALEEAGAKAAQVDRILGGNLAALLPA